MSLLEARGLWVRPPGALRSGGGSLGGGRPGDEDGYVVRGASLALEPGEWLGVTGPNGGGKTTLLMALGGLWPAARGEVRVGGDRFEPGSPRQVRSRVAVLLQDPSSQLLQPTVRDEVAFTARNLDLAADAIEQGCARWISRFGLGDVLDADPSSLSAGRQQAVLLAGALAAGPRVVIADEPGAHLDSRSRSRILSALVEEKKSGLSLIWATQDRDEMAVADRVLWVGADERDSDPGVPVEPAAANGGEPLLELKVAPVAATSGPRIEAGSGFALRIGTNEAVAITGPNGAGKSVLLACASGLESIPQVQAVWSSTSSQPPILVAQYPERLFFEEVVRDEVVFAAVSRGSDRERALQEARECFSVLNMDDDIIHRRLWELSGGMRRLVEVVAALVAPAALIALDEPTAGLDASRRERLARLVRRRARSSAVLIASQDLSWVGRVGARTTPLGHTTVTSTPSLSKKTD